MATRYVEPVPRDFYPVPFRSLKDHEFATYFDKMTHHFKQGCAITDLKGLELMAQLLYHLENYRSDKNQNALNISIVFALNKLAEMVDLLMNFRPMMRETTGTHMRICQSLNFGSCYENFLNYIEQVSSRLITLVKESVIQTSQSTFVLYLERIQFYVHHVKMCIADKLSEFPATEYQLTEFHWNTISKYRDSVSVPELIRKIFSEFQQTRSPLPPWMIPSHSPGITRLWHSQDSDLKETADGGVCCLCHLNVASIVHMSVMPYCNHVFCALCLTNWLLRNGNGQWSCPTCGQRMTEYASVSGEEFKVISFLVPPHQQVITLELRPNVNTNNRE